MTLRCRDECKSLLIIPLRRIVFTGSVFEQPRMLYFSYFQGDLQDVKFRLGTQCLEDCPPPKGVSDHRSIGKECRFAMTFKQVDDPRK